MSDQTIPAPAVANVDTHNPVAAMRQTIDAAKAENAALAAKVAEYEAAQKEADRAKLGEIEALKAERNELLGIRAEHAKMADRLKADYASEFGQLTEEQRFKVEPLITGTDPAARLEQLRNLKSLIVVAPTPVGTVTPTRTDFAPPTENQRVDAKTAFQLGPSLYFDTPQAKVKLENARNQLEANAQV